MSLELKIKSKHLGEEARRLRAALLVALRLGLELLQQLALLIARIGGLAFLGLQGAAGEQRDGA